MTWAEIQGGTLNWLSHPGTPVCGIFDLKLDELTHHGFQAKRGSRADLGGPVGFNCHAVLWLWLGHIASLAQVALNKEALGIEALRFFLARIFTILCEVPVYPEPVERGGRILTPLYVSFSPFLWRNRWSCDIHDHNRCHEAICQKLILGPTEQ